MQQSASLVVQLATLAVAAGSLPLYCSTHKCFQVGTKSVSGNAVSVKWQNISSSHLKQIDKYIDGILAQSIIQKIPVPKLTHSSND